MSNIQEEMQLVGKGWHDLLIKLDQKLKQTDPDYYIEQIKEKFGGSRFYTSGLSEEGYKAVEEAEALAAKTCEACGCESKITSVNGWLTTICDKCRGS